MSNKKLLSESEVRRFMTLANIPSLNEGSGQMPYDAPDRRPVPKGEEARLKEMSSPMGEEEEELDLGDELGGDAGGEMDAGMGDEMGVGDEMGGDAAPAGDMQDAFKKAVEALAQAFGVKASVEDGAEGAGEPADDLEMDAGDGGEGEGEEEEEEGEEEEEEGEELDEAEEVEEGDELDEGEDKKKKGKEDKGEEEEEEVEESVSSTDELVETVLRRVTARLLAEKKDAEKKGAKKLSAKDKMAAMRAKKKGAKGAKKPVKEANAKAPKAGQSNAAKNGLKPAGKPGDGGWEGSGQQDQAFKEGVKNSKGGHQFKPVAAKGPHTITHKKTNPLPSKGGNKTR